MREPGIVLYKRRDFGEKFTVTFQFIRENWKPLLKYLTAFLLPIAILQGFSMSAYMDNAFIAGLYISSGAEENGMLALLGLPYLFLIVFSLLGGILLYAVFYALFITYDRREKGLRGVTWSALSAEFLRCLKRSATCFGFNILLMVLYLVLMVLLASLSVATLIVTVPLLLACLVPLMIFYPAYMLDERSAGIWNTFLWSMRNGFKCWGGSFLILFSKVITRIMVADSYYESWQYIPLLSVATVYSCMVTFLGTVYVVNKKSTLSLATTAAGAIVNVVLSFFLISYFGINGAAFAMFASYFVVFLLRAHDTKRFIHMRIGGFRITVNTLLLLAQAFVMIYEIPYWIAVEILLTAAMVLLNLSGLLAGVKKILPSRKKASA